MDRLSRFLVLCISALLLAHGASVMAAGGYPKALKELIDGAKQEKELVYATSGETPELIAELGQRFNEKFGLNVELKGVPLRSSAAATRIVQEKAANRLTIDLTHPSYTLVQRFVGKGILADFDWVGTFSEVLPGIKEAATHVPEFLKGKVLDYQHLVYIGIANNKLLASSEIPKKWDDLLDAKWKGQKIGLDPRGTSVYLLFLVYGEEWVLDYAQKLVNQEPLFIRGSANIAKAVARGEVPFGITGFSNIIEQKMRGNPVVVAPLGASGVVPQVLVPVAGAPHPNAAKLFAAWMATEGMLILQKSDGTGRAWPGSNWIMAKELENEHVKLAFASTEKEIEEASKLVAKVSKIMQQKR